MPRPSRNQLTFAHECASIWADPNREPNVGYMAKTFAVTSLPYQNPGEDVVVWHRRNGGFLLKVTPGGEVTGGTGKRLGFPYGAIPRLLLAYLSTEAVRTRSPDIKLPPSQAQFLGKLGMKATGGKNGTIPRLREQADRLFEANFTLRWDMDPDRDVGVTKFSIAHQWQLDWTPASKRSNRTNRVSLSAEFFNELISGPIPLDLDAYLAFDGSALCMDLYTWLTFRLARLEHPVTIPYEAMQGHFGYQLPDDIKGRSKFKSLLIKNLPYVLNIYREARVEPTKTGLLLNPSPPHIPFRGMRRLAAAG